MLILSVDGVPAGTNLPSQVSCGPKSHPWNPGHLLLSSWSLCTYRLLGLSLSFGVLEISNSILVPRPAWALTAASILGEAIGDL